MKWWAGRYHLHCAATSQVPDAARFDAFMDEEAKRSPVLARWRAVIKNTLLTKCYHDSLRQGMWSHILLLLEQVAEMCAATDKNKYQR